MGSGRLCRRSRPGPSFSCARLASTKSESRRRRDEPAWVAPRAADGGVTPCFTGCVLERITKRILGGSDGNEQLTAIVATLLLLLLAVEGATLLNMRSLLTVHAFVGVLLIPVVAVKLGSTGWRMLRYYLGADEYVRRGPPHLLLRAIVAPVIVASTIVLFGSGVGSARARAARRSARRPAQGELPRLVRGDDGPRADQGVQVADARSGCPHPASHSASAPSVRRSSRGSRSPPSRCRRSTIYRTASPRTSASIRTRSRNPAKPNLPNPRLTF